MGKDSVVLPAELRKFSREISRGKVLDDMSGALRYERHRILFRVKVLEWATEQSFRGFLEVGHLDKKAQAAGAFRPEMAEDRGARHPDDRAVARDVIKE